MRSLSRFALAVTIVFVAPLAHAFDVLTGMDGQTRTLDDYLVAGKWNVVMVWASDCGVCNREIGQYIAFYNKHKDRDATVIGISVDGRKNKKDAEAFIERHKVNFPNAIAELSMVTTTLPLMAGQEWSGTPTFLVYKPNGELAGMQVGAVPTDVIEDFIARESASP